MIINYTSFAVVKLLAGKTGSADKSINLEGGTVAPTEVERQKRWEGHCCAVFGGEIATFDELRRRNVEPSEFAVGQPELSDSAQVPLEKAEAQS